MEFRLKPLEELIESRLASKVPKLNSETSRSLTTPPPSKAAESAAAVAFGSATNAKKARSPLAAASLADASLAAASLGASSIAASTAGDAEEGTAGSTAAAAVATGSTVAVSAAGSILACMSASSERPGGCLEFGLEGAEKPKELREPYSACPDILLFA